MPGMNVICTAPFVTIFTRTRLALVYGRQALSARANATAAESDALRLIEAGRFCPSAVTD